MPPSRRQGADPAKLARQIALFGRSAVGMPPPWVYEGTDGILVLYNGVTRATRIAKLAPGILIRVEVRQTFGQALFDAQTGGKHPDAKPLKGFGGAGVLEIVEDDDGTTYRAVYTVRLAGAVYVLHAFQKKSKSCIKTPAEEIEKVKRRLKEAERHHAERAQTQKRKEEGHH